MSFREKSAWISVVTYVGVYGYYFWTVFKVVAAGQTSSFHFGALLVEVVFLLAAVQIVLQVIVSVMNSKEAQAAQDEREKLISLKATRVAFHVVMIGAATTAAAIAFGAPGVYTANGLFLVVVIAEVVKNAGQIILYRLGA